MPVGLDFHFFPVGLSEVSNVADGNLSKCTGTVTVEVSHTSHLESWSTCDWMQPLHATSSWGSWVLAHL